MIIVDSSVLIDHISNRVTASTTWLMQRAFVERLGITTLILCEVLQGIRTDGQWSAVKQRLLQFEVHEISDQALAIAAASNYRSLRSNGYTVRNTIGCLIATFCIQQNHTLLHNDRDYDAFERHLGLRVIHPPAIAIQ